jgi:hypothetical protein
MTSKFVTWPSSNIARTVISLIRFLMKSTKDEMLPRPNIVKVSDPIVTGVDPVPDKSSSKKAAKKLTVEAVLAEKLPSAQNHSCCISAQMKRSPTTIRVSSVDRVVARTTTPRVRHGNGAGLRLRSSLSGRSPYRRTCLGIKQRKMIHRNDKVSSY